MIRTERKTNPVSRPLPDMFSDVHNRIALSLVGQAVSLVVDPETIAQGVVTNALTETGVPKIVVRGTRYDLGQILTAVPASLVS